MANSERLEVSRIDQATVDAVVDLIPDAPEPARDNGACLPHRLGHGESEALREALLDDDVGATLERVDDDSVLLDVVRGEVRDVDPTSHRFAQAGPSLSKLLQDGDGLGVVADGRRRRAGELPDGRRRAPGSARNRP